MIFTGRDLRSCVDFCVNVGYSVNLIPLTAYSGDLEMVVTDYVDADREIVYRTFTLCFHDWKCTGYKGD